MSLTHRFASLSNLPENEPSISDFPPTSAAGGAWVTGVAMAHATPAGVWVAGQRLTQQQVYEAAYTMAVAQVREAARVHSAVFRRVTAAGVN